MKGFHLLFALLLMLFVVGCTEQVTAPEAADFAEPAASTPLPGAEEALHAGKATAAGTALVQVIHNAPDAAARRVDVYVNGALALDNFRYRAATPFLELPVELEVAIAPWTSESVDDAIATFNYSLAEGEAYVVVAAGLLGAAPSFDLYPYAPARTAAEDPSLVDILAFHGSPDAPTVDVVARGVATLVDDFSFGDFQGYVSVPAASYTLDVTTSDQSVTAASFRADLSGLAGGAAVVLATGLLSGENPPFGLIAVLPDGTVVRLPDITS